MDVICHIYCTYTDDGSWLNLMDVRLQEVELVKNPHITLGAVGSSSPRLQLYNYPIYLVRLDRYHTVRRS